MPGISEAHVAPASLTITRTSLVGSFFFGSVLSPRSPSVRLVGQKGEYGRMYLYVSIRLSLDGGPRTLQARERLARLCKLKYCVFLDLLMGNFTLQRLCEHVQTPSWTLLRTEAKKKSRRREPALGLEYVWR